jgi:hypothetical protein
METLVAGAAPETLVEDGHCGEPGDRCTGQCETVFVSAKPDEKVPGLVNGLPLLWSGVR